MNEMKIKSMETQTIVQKGFCQKCLGQGKNTAVIPPVKYILTSFIASFLGILAISYVALEAQLFALFPPLGASAVLLYGAPSALFSQPRNLLGGHLIAALVGVIIHRVLGINVVSIALAVSLAIVIMLTTKTTHPPAGATALLGVAASEGSFLWPFIPVAISVLILLLVALIVNNLDNNRSYPEFWY